MNLLIKYGIIVATKQPDNWQTWCSIGGLNPSDYGSLANVVASPTAMTVLASATNAVEYMILSKSVIMPAVVGSSNAMTKLDANTYAIAAMFKNTAWYAAMMGSTTAVTALDSTAIVTPTMTSNTTPNGTVSASSATADGAAFKAFDKNKTTTAWFIQANLTGKYIQYQFPQNIRVYKVVVNNCISNTDRTLVNGITVYTGADVLTTMNLINSSASENTKLITSLAPLNTTYKITLDSLHSANTYTGLAEVQFYGKSIA